MRSMTGRPLKGLQRHEVISPLSRATPYKPFHTCSPGKPFLVLRWKAWQQHLADIVHPKSISWVWSSFVIATCLYPKEKWPEIFITVGGFVPGARLSVKWGLYPPVQTGTYHTIVAFMFPFQRKRHFRTVNVVRGMFSFKKIYRAFEGAEW